jgi:quinoprotein glucose dehydrogenase
MVSRVVVYGYAIILAGIALALIGGGGYLVRLGGSSYYLLCGMAVLTSAVLLWRRRWESATVYGLMLLATIAWALWESGYDGWALMPRIVALAVVGLPFLIPSVKRSLVRRKAPRPVGVIIGSIVVALGVGAALHALMPPFVPKDPVYRVGFAPASAAHTVPKKDAIADGDWRNVGNDAGATRYSPLDQITPGNVGRMELAWTYRIGNGRSRLIGTPLKIDRTLYSCSSLNDLIAVDAETGQERWHFDAKTDPKRATFTYCRGAAYYKAPPGFTGACAERIITNTIDARLIAVDARDGKPCADFGENGVVSLLTGLGKVEAGYYTPSSAPTVVRGKIIVGAHVADNQYWGEPSGVIRAFDALTGKLAWAWDMGHPERKGEPPAGETYTPSTPNSWAPMSADENLGLVYVPTGNPTPDYFGAQRRPFDEKYGTSVVALDAETGEPRWSFQNVHHDLWDLDTASPPTLVDLPTANGITPALIQPTKRGEIFILNRVTGEPIFPVEERPTPQTGGPPDDRLSPTQPYSAALPAFSGPDLVESSMWGVTPLDQLWCRVKFRQARYEGLMTPLGLTPAITPFFSLNWGGVAVDSERQIMIVNNTILHTYGRLLPRAEADKLGFRPFTAANSYHYAEGQHDAQWGTPYGVMNGQFMSPLSAPCPQPPYGALSAVDLRSGKLLWTQPLGTAQEIGPLGIPSHLPLRIGTPVFGGSVVTAGGVTFIAASQDRHLRAFDTATGKLLWETQLRGGGPASPMSYLSTVSGRQFIAISVSGADGFVPGDGDYIVAYALPKAAATVDERRPE